MKLTPLQHKALSGLAQAGSAGESAYGLRVSNGTLLALARRGLARRVPKLGDLFFPRGRTFVITDAGREEAAKGA